jgi:hypothetical protein
LWFGRIEYAGLAETEILIRNLLFRYRSQGR